MATSTSPLARQPDKLDYLSPTQFKFNIHQLPKVEFFTTAANVPDLTLSDAVIPTPFKPIPVMGQNLTILSLIGIVAAISCQDKLCSMTISIKPAESKAKL